MTRKAMFPLMVLLVLVSIDAARASDQMPAPAAVISLEALADQADLVALVQARDTDYIYRRNFPAGGSAFLHVLIPYKNARLDDIIEVYEHGMSEHGCYFPNPTVFEEGRRYLVFLREDKEKPGRFRGLATGCALDVLVAQDNSYAVRLPATGITLSDPLDGYR
ncbi:MAG: hypothetical protein ACREO9_08565, partial [Lysobacterales bacterium]